MRRLIIVFIFIMLVTACSSERPVAPSGHEGGLYKIGEPYQVAGTWYYPHEDYSYDETGIASWYGTGFHGLRTANGEIFDKNAITAAHKTLPLPTLARVTNLENGRSIVVRINDRGPFSRSRLIDLSEKTAQLLGFEKQGTAKVRVQVLADESRAIAEAMHRSGTVVASTTVPADQPHVFAASVTPVSTQTVAMGQPLSLLPDEMATPSPEIEHLEPTRTTPQIHQALLTTVPVPMVVQYPVHGANQIFIQAGAFSTLENATKLQHKLQSYGSAQVSSSSVNGRQFYRVRLGPVANVSQADQLLRQISQAEALKPRIVIE